MAAHHLQARMQRPPQPAARASVVAVVVAVVVACSTSSRSAPLDAASTSPPAPPQSATTTTLDPTATAVLAAYRDDENVYLAVAGHYPIMASDPRLAQVMTGTELATVRKNLTLASLHRQYATGTIDLAPVVSSVSGTTATISDCSFDHTRIIDGKTQQTITTGDTARGLQKVTMALEHGTWKISDEQTMGSGCVPTT
jgi:hypothetical protein